MPFVCWLPTSEPWTVEANLVATLSLPLNLRGNERHPFYAMLASI